MSELRRKSVMNIFSELKIAIGIACIAAVSATAVQAQEDTIKVGILPRGLTARYSGGSIAGVRVRIGRGS